MPKLVKFAVIFCLVIFLAFVGYAVYRQENYKETFVRNVDKEIDPERRSKIESTITKINLELETVQSDADKIDLLRDKSKLLQELGSLEEAERVLNEAVNISSNDAGVYTDLFELQVEMKNYQSAERSILRAINLSPSGSRLEKYAAFAKEYLSADEEKINQVYLEALDDSGNSVAMLKAYAEYKESVGNILMARDFWVKVKEKNPENAAEYDVHINRLTEQLPEDAR